MAIKSLTASLHILALGTLLAVHVAAPAELKLPGVRKALQTIDGQTVPFAASNGVAIAKIA